MAKSKTRRVADRDLATALPTEPLRQAVLQEFTRRDLVRFVRHEATRGEAREEVERSVGQCTGIASSTGAPAARGRHLSDLPHEAVRIGETHFSAHPFTLSKLAAAGSRGFVTIG